MTSIRSTLRRRLMMGCLLCSLASTAAWSQNTGDPLISIVQPAYNSTQPGTTVSVSVHFGIRAVSRTFHAEIDGTDITNLFMPEGPCGLTGNCDMRAYLPGSGLLTGTHIVTAHVAGPNDSTATVRTRFDYAGPSALGAPVTQMIPAISVQSVKLPAGANTNDTNSYQIVVGPGPGFAQKAYTTDGISCSAGINSMQVLVLNRLTLAPESKVNSTRLPGQNCLGSAAELATFLKGLPSNDVVIMNSFLGTMANLDTTAIGGSKYSTVQPHYYSAIGLAGAKAGTAFETYQSNDSHTPRTGRDHLPALVGSLMLDTAQQYFFAPSSYPDFKVTAGERSTDGCASVEYGVTYRQCSDSSGAGGFWILAIDRLTGAVTDHYVLHTNATNATYAREQIQDLGYLLSAYYKSNDLLILTTFGQPIGKNAPVTPALFNAVSALGGNAYHLAQLTDTKASYALISVRDPDYVARHYPVQRFDDGTGKDYGPLHVQLMKNRLNRYVVNVSAQDQQLLHPFGFEWSKVLFQQPRDWPQWTPAQQAAYLDLTADSNHYPRVSSYLGCTPGTCHPIRSYYGDAIGTGKPAFMTLPYASLVYYPNTQYAQSDFDSMIKQLEIEQGYESNVYDAYSQFAAVTQSADANIKQQLTAVARSIDASLINSNAQSTAITAGQLNRASAVTGLLSVLPGVGPAAGAVSAALTAAAELTPVGSTPMPDGYSFTLGQLRDGTATIGADMSASTLTVFSGVVQDWGKLSTIGAGIGARRAPWKMCYTCEGANLPVNGVPMFALGAKQDFYERLMPTVYSSDVFTQLGFSDPRKLKRLVTNAGGGQSCNAPYGRAPDATFWSYSNVGLPATWDVFTITQTKRTPVFGASYDQLSFPSDSLLQELFGAAQYTTSSNPGGTPVYHLSGGASLEQDQLLPTDLGGYMSRRSGYLPGSASSKCPQ